MYVCKDLKLIVTTKPGKENVVENQVGDSLYIDDPNVRIVHTRYPGLLLVYTRLSPWRAFWLVNTYPIHAASRIVPIECCGYNIDSALKCIDELLSRPRKYGEKLGVEITVRGSIIDRGELRNKIYKLIEKKGLRVVYKGATYELKVEIVDNIIGVSIMPWRADRISRRIREWIKRLGINNFVSS